MNILGSISIIVCISVLKKKKNKKRKKERKSASPCRIACCTRVFIILCIPIFLYGVYYYTTILHMYYDQDLVDSIYGTTLAPVILFPMIHDPTRLPIRR